VEEVNGITARQSPVVSGQDEHKERFADDCDLRRMSSSAVERYVSPIKAFRGYIEARGYSFVDADDREVLRDFLNHLRRDRMLSQETIENSFTALSSFYEYLEYEDYADKNHFGSVGKRYIRRYRYHELAQRV
jgi:integrase/recombinase XerD